MSQAHGDLTTESIVQPLNNCGLVDTIFAWLKQIFTRLNKLKGSGQKRRNSHFGFFELILCSKVVDFLHVTQPYCIC